MHLDARLRLHILMQEVEKCDGFILCLIFEPERSAEQADMSPTFCPFGEVGFRNLRMCKAEGYDSDI